MTSYEIPPHMRGGKGSGARAKMRCGNCRQSGHNRRNCPLLRVAVEKYRQEQQILFDEMWDAPGNEDGIEMIEVDFSTPPLNRNGEKKEDNDTILEFVVEPKHGWILGDKLSTDGTDEGCLYGLRILGKMKWHDCMVWDWDECETFDAKEDVEWWAFFDWQ